MNCSNLKQYWACAGQNHSNTIKINWGFTVLSRSRTVLSPSFPAALCHGILETFCSQSLAHSSIPMADDRRALHSPAVRNHLTPSLLSFDLLYSNTSPSSWRVLIMLGWHH